MDENKKDQDEKRYLFDNPRNVNILVWALYIVCAVLILLDFVIKRYQDHPWESLFGFYGIYGFVCCTFLVLAATVMRKVVMRKEDYYDD